MLWDISEFTRKLNKGLLVSIKVIPIVHYTRFLIFPEDLSPGLGMDLIQPFPKCGDEMTVSFPPPLLRKKGSSQIFLLLLHTFSR